ncbi:RHS repeat-associated core domain-containing protein [Alcanivorax sp. 1008]|uniref:RHS repeat-associated core domain-containing protein n=1 Tax=Alcanivorax sp. 1008 TaxID=2816853 RepID=UPI001DB57BC9|nr:RHS repeat-associated core domain-containing protein [Alcanivorax sp. 1008]MCC1496314.1 RHS domain-containing protein [Alcanivorax sp. 1008]
MNLIEYTLGHTPTSFTQNDNRYYIATDHLGSPSAISDASGNIVKAVSYDSYGNTLSDSNPAFTIPFGFAGGLQDSDTGLIRFGFRDYDPSVRRWTARDPIGLNGGLNVYGYVVGDPVNLVDPEGLEPAFPGVSFGGGQILVGSVHGGVLVRGIAWPAMWVVLLMGSNVMFNALGKVCLHRFPRLVFFVPILFLGACGESPNGGMQALIYGNSDSGHSDEVLLKKYKEVLEDAHYVVVETDGLNPEAGDYVEKVYKKLSLCRYSECNDYIQDYAILAKLIDQITSNVVSESELAHFRPWSIYYSAMEIFTSECRRRTAANSRSLEKRIIEHARGLESYMGDVVGVHEKILAASLEEDHVYLNAIKSFDALSIDSLCDGNPVYSPKVFDVSHSMVRSIVESRMTDRIYSLENRYGVAIFQSEMYCGSSYLRRLIPLHRESLSCGNADEF